MKSISLFEHNGVTTLSAIYLMLIKLVGYFKNLVVNKPHCIRTGFEHIHSAGVQARNREELESLVCVYLTRL